MINRIRIAKDVPNPTVALQRAIAAILPNCENVIEFEQGTYYFHRQGCESHTLYASSAAVHDICVLFPLLRQRNLTIEGNGSDFIFCDRLQPFFMERCQNLTLKNFQMDYAFLRYAYATVVSIDNEGFAVSLDKDLFDYRISDGFLSFVCGEDTLSTETRKISMKRIFPTKSRTYFLYAGDTKAEKNPAARSVDVDAKETGDGVYFQYRADTTHPDFNVGDVLCLAYDNDREAQAFYAESCREIRLENIAVYRNAGMGFVADDCENVTLDGLRFAIKSGRREYYSSTADAIFLTNCRGEFVLQNSTICDTYDDAINVHGYYSKIERIISDTCVELGFLHPTHWGLIPCRVGDTLVISDPETMEELGSGKVLSVSYDEHRRNIRVELERGTPIRVGAFLENVDATPKVRIENNCVRNCPHMRLSAKHMRVCKNDLDLNEAAIYIYDLIAFWGECGTVQSAEICDNRFGKDGKYSIEIGSCRPTGCGKMHESIRIENNVFAKSKEDSIVYSSVRNLVLQNNRFEAEE